MNKKISNKPEQRFDKEFEQEREAAKKNFTEEDRKSFWEKYDVNEKRKPEERKTFDNNKKPYKKRDGDNAGYEKRPYERKSFDGNRKPYKKREGDNEGYEKIPYEKKSFDGDRKPYEKKPYHKLSSDGESFRKFPEKRKSKFDNRPPEGDKKQRGSGFTRHFDNENPMEKAYDAQGIRSVKPEKEAQESIHEMPLNKYISHCGVCSRRDAVLLIKDKKVTVNGVVVEQPGYKIQENDVIKLEGKPLVIQKNLVYVLLNKPKGFITTTDDPKGRRTVMDILGDNVDERVFPVGRLDRSTTGLLLLTNDGELAQRLSHPKYENRKIYQVSLDKDLTKEDFNKILKGVELEDGVAQVDQLAILDKNTEIGLEIHSGKNRIVRRIFESLGYVVEKLDRVMYAGLTKKNLKRGQWRFLSKQETINLKHLKK